MKRLLIFLLFAFPLHAQTITGIVVQPAEWTNMPLPYPSASSLSATSPSGTRTNAPVTFGIGIPDSAQIDCPNAVATTSGNWQLPQNEEAPTKLELYYSGVKTNAQFRCMGMWPDGYAEWVLVDAQIASFSETTGIDTNLSLVKVSSGGGNNPATAMGVQCTGTNTPVSACPDANHIVVNTGTATTQIKENNYNVFDDVTVGAAHVVSSSNHFVTDGLFLLGPPTSATGMDGVSCWSGLANTSGPVPTNYVGSSSCAGVYLSTNDGSSTCVLEDNGPLRTTVMCQGNLVDATHIHTYMRWRTRTTFWANQSWAKVSVALRNADVVTAQTVQFANAYKEYQQFEIRLTENLGAGTTRNIDFGTVGANSTTTISSSNGTDSVFLEQMQSTNGDYNDTEAFGLCTTFGDQCRVPPVSRSGTTVSNRQYALTGWQIIKNGSTAITNGTNAQYVTGWADEDDGSNGIEVGHYQMSMYYPKSLEFDPGNTNYTQIRVGLMPNQMQWDLTENPVNGSYASTSSNKPCVTASPCQPQITYVQGWPQYSKYHTLWNFHSGTQTALVAQQNFLYMQHYMLARPSTPTYYNTVTDSLSGIPALFDPIPDPVAEDDFYLSLVTAGNANGACANSGPAGTCVADVNQTGYPYSGTFYAGVKAFPVFAWGTAGGVNGTQFDQRLAFERNFEQRGCTPNGAGTACASPSLTGSDPGRFVWATHWYEMVEDTTFAHSDTASTYGSSAGFRSLCTSITGCSTSSGNLNFFRWGDPQNNTSPNPWNGGQRNCGDCATGMDHSSYHGIIYHYFWTGDEWAHEAISQGLKDRYLNAYVDYNNLDANPTGNSAPGHGHIVSPRAVGQWLLGGALLADFLASVCDADADTATQGLNCGNSNTNWNSTGHPSEYYSPGLGPGQTTVFQSLQQVIASNVALPYVSHGLPLGWNETTFVNCAILGTPTNQCSQGQDPETGFVRPGASGESCNGSTVPCNSGGGSTIYHPTNDTFQANTWAEGVARFHDESVKLMGLNWHQTIGQQSGVPATTTDRCATGTQYLIDGCTGINNVVIGEKMLLDAVYGVYSNLAGTYSGGLVVGSNCVNTGVFNTSGCVYDNFADYLNASPGCTKSGNCLHDCSVGCNNTDIWYGITASWAVSNATLDLAGNSWQQNLEFALLGPGFLPQDLGDYVMQGAVNTIINSGSCGFTSPICTANGYAVSSSVPVMKVVSGGALNGITVTSCTGTGCSSGTGGFSGQVCIGPTSGTGTCTLTWTAPSGISTVNGVSYRLKYFPCQSGVLTVYGNDCPAQGKVIVPSLGWRSDITTAGTTAADGSGSWVLNPANYQAIFATAEAPDGILNSTVPTCCSYTFNTQANTTYTFYLEANQTATAPTPTITITPATQSFPSTVVSNTSAAQSATVTNTLGSTASLSASITGDFSNAGTGSCGATLANGASCTYNLTFTPTTTGTRTGTFSVTYSAGTVVNAASCNQSDVQTAMNSVGSGAYVVKIPSGTCTWATQLSSTIPSGNTSLIIQGNTTVTGNCSPSSPGCVAADNTIIIDGTSPGAANYMWQINTNSTTTSSLRITGITFRLGSGNTKQNGTIQVTGYSQNFRFDHNHPNASTASGSQNWALRMTSGCILGVADHNVVTAQLSGAEDGFEMYNDSCSGSLDYGNYNWAQPTNFGGLNAFFIENNYFVGTTSGNFAAMNDCYEDGKQVIRYNVMQNMGIQVHPTGGAGDWRGCRSTEFYNNSLTSTYTPGFAVGFFESSGPALIYNNTVASGFVNSLVRLVESRDGSVYTTDPNHGSLVPTPHGWGFCGPSPIATGTVTANGTTTVTSAGLFNTSWPAGSPIVINVNPTLATASNTFYIASVSSTSSMTLTASVTTGSYTFWAGSLWDGGASGHVCYPGIDQAGRGQGDLLTGAFTSKVDSATSTITWPNQALEPVREWLDTYSGSLFQVANSADASMFTQNTDYYQNQTSGCSGTQTTGDCSGLLSSRATNCTAGVAFWETDNLQLDYCYATNTWSTRLSGPSSYAPAIYPHPLDTSSGSSGTLTESLTGTGTSSGVVTLTPTSYGFPSTPAGCAGGCPVVTISLTNNAGTTITVSSTPTITGTNAVDFALNTGTCPNGTVVVTTASCQIFVTFAPATDLGALVATLNVAYTGASGSPMTVALSGTSLPNPPQNAAAVIGFAGNLKVDGDLNAQNQAPPVADTRKVVIQGKEFTRGGGK
jgi:hypothetical protein